MTGADVGPYVLGASRARIVVSQRVVEYLSVEELRAVLLHEECHRRRRDPLMAALRRLAVTLLFFYPPVWWMALRIRRTAELACDEAVLDPFGAPPIFSLAP